jgi:tetratricopeptide (TPR) repeat protein
MKRSLLLALLFTGLVALAEGPDDLYLKSYSLIEEAEGLGKLGQSKAAVDKLKEAQTTLQKIGESYPRWNESIVRFRLNDVAQRLEPLGQKTPAETATPVKSEPAALQGELSSLRGQVATLEAKLKEALSLQSSGLSAAERVRLEEKALTLQKEQDIIKVALEQEKARATKAEATAAEAKALADDGRRARQLAKEKEELEAKLKDQAAQLVRASQAGAAERDALQKAVATATATSSAQASDLSQLRQRLTAIETERNQLRDASDKSARSQEERFAATGREKEFAEKKAAALQVQLDQLRGRLTETESRLTQAAPDTRLKVLETEKSGVEAELNKTKAELKQAKQSLESEQAKTATLSQETKMVELRAAADNARRVKKLEDDLAAAQKKLASVEARPAIQATKPEVKEVRPVANSTIVQLEAKLAALEAKAAPYTKEELALFKAPPVVVMAVAETNAVTAKKSVRRVPPGAGQLVAEAERAFTARRYVEAEQKFAEALKQEEDNVYLLANLASAQFEQGKIADAEKQLAHALKVDADDPASLTLMGIVRFQQDKFDEALAHLSRSAQLDPNNADTQNYLGITLSQKGQRGPAEAALRKSIQLSPDNPGAHHNLAIIYATQKPSFVELAKFHYKKSLALGHPKNPSLEEMLK